jgi:hypothetical protein
MGKVKVSMAMSLDGFVAGPDPTLEEPLGRGGMSSTSGCSASRSFVAPTARRAGR